VTTGKTIQYKLASNTRYSQSIRAMARCGSIGIIAFIILYINRMN